MRGYATGTHSATDIIAVTTSDTTNDPNGPFRGLVFKTAGAIKIRTQDGNDVVLPSGLLAEGVIHAIAFNFVWTTGTTATDIYGVV